jgi:Spy/CpxP family protein refolding chaperone
MRRAALLVTIAVLAVSAITVPLAAQSTAAPRARHNHEMRAQRHLQRDLARDRADLRRDQRDIRQDRRRMQMNRRARQRNHARRDWEAI